MSLFVYREVDSLRLNLGHGVVIGVLCIGRVVGPIAVLVHRRFSRMKEEMCAREGTVECEERRGEYRGLGDASPLFRCVI